MHRRADVDQARAIIQHVQGASAARASLALAVANMCCEDSLRAIMAEQVTLLTKIRAFRTFNLSLQFHAFNCMFPLLEHRDIEVRARDRLKRFVNLSAGGSQH